MAVLPSISRSPFIFPFFLLAISIAAKPIQLRKEKTSHLRFYFHDIVSGPNPTSVQVAAALSTAKSPTFFGAVLVIDDPLTEGPDPKSKLIGRAQGLYALASEEDGLLVALNYVFVDGKYNGSTLSILGRNAVFDKVREMPVLGGSGLFRFARGYAEARTLTFNLTSKYAVVEYNVYVIRFSYLFQEMD